MLRWIVNGYGRISNAWTFDSDPLFTLKCPGE
jgi:hypothetical protein